MEAKYPAKATTKAHLNLSRFGRFPLREAAPIDGMGPGGRGHLIRSATLLVQTQRAISPKSQKWVHAKLSNHARSLVLVALSVLAPAS